MLSPWLLSLLSRCSLSSLALAIKTVLKCQIDTREIMRGKAQGVMVKFHWPSLGKILTICIFLLKFYPNAVNVFQNIVKSHTKDQVNFL